MLPSSGICSRVVRIWTDVSEERIENQPSKKPECRRCLAACYTTGSFSVDFLPWRWRWYVLQKRRFINGQLCAVSQKMATFFLYYRTQFRAENRNRQLQNKGEPTSMPQCFRVPPSPHTHTRFAVTCISSWFFLPNDSAFIHSKKEMGVGDAPLWLLSVPSTPLYFRFMVKASFISRLPTPFLLFLSFGFGQILSSHPASSSYKNLLSFIVCYKSYFRIQQPNVNLCTTIVRNPRKPLLKSLRPSVSRHETIRNQLNAFPLQVRYSGILITGRISILLEIRSKWH
jgi:hypothetical protein